MVGKRVAGLLRTQWFSVAMLVLFGLAWVRPGLPGRLRAGGWTDSAAIVTIFFVSGAALRAGDVWRGVANWRLHLFIQGFSFVLCPLLCWLALMPWRRVLPEGLVLGFYLLSVLPMTITSGAILTQLAGGSFAGALFNAVLGNVLGMIVSPALFFFMIGATTTAIDVHPADVFMKLARLALFPLLLGQTAGRFGFDRIPGRIRTLVNQCCILLIVYFAFGSLFTGGLAGQAAGTLALPIALLIPAHLLILRAAWWGAKLAGFGHADRLAALFCAPQKTMALGLPLVTATLADRPDLAGLAALPVIVYHSLQLLAAGLLVERVRLRTGADQEE